MIYRLVPAIFISLQLLCLSSFAQTNSSSEWTLVCFNKTRAYFYTGTLTDWKQVTVLNLLDSFQVRRITNQKKKDAPGAFTMVLKGSAAGGQEGMVNLFETAGWISNKWTIQPLNAKEKELFELSDLDSKPEPMKLKAPEMPGNKYALYIRIKNDSTIWYKTDTSYNEAGYTRVNKEDKTAFAALIDSYQQQCEAKKLPEAVYIAGSSKAGYTDFSFVVNELNRHKIYKYNLITAPN